MPSVPNSILDSTKKALGIDADYDAFDIDIIMHVNSVIAKLTQLGVGPSDGYMIEDQNNVWSEFLADKLTLNFVKSYMYLNVKLLFDPNMPGPVLGAYERQIAELTFRINVAADQSGDTSNGPFMWTLDSDNNFPEDAQIGDLGINPNTGDIFRKTT